MYANEIRNIRVLHMNKRHFSLFEAALMLRHPLFKRCMYIYI